MIVRNNNGEKIKENKGVFGKKKIKLRWVRFGFS